MFHGPITSGDSGQESPLSSRSWQEIAHELAYETDPDRFTRLAEELNAALEEQIAFPSSVSD